MLTGDACNDIVSKNRALRRHADGLAEIVYDHLDHVSVIELRKLKRRLRNFNAKTGEWRNYE